MTLSKDHYVHLQNGRFNDHTETSAHDIDAMLQSYFASPSQHGLLLHFHGGLVAKDSGKEIAEKLTVRFGHNTHFVGFVWESGALETVKNNLNEIATEELFQRLLGKAVVWILKRLALDLESTKGISGKGVATNGVVNEVQVESEIRSWLNSTAAPSRHAPYDELEGELQPDQGTALEPDQADPEIQIDIESDGPLRVALDHVSNGQLGAPKMATSKGGFVTGSANTLMSEEGLAKLREPALSGAKGLLSSAKLALYVTKIVFRSVWRLSCGHGHGIYTTAVEEILREFYIGAAGKSFFWDRMKQDTHDAFGADEDLCGGTAFLKRLRQQMEANGHSPRITLSGHSTGAIYICHFLDAAAKWVPDLKFDVVLLAPAASCELFGKTVIKHKTRINGFRCFAMRDDLERNDRLVSLLYPRSLLYFVSGVVESSQSADVPLVGMQRYHSQKKPYKGAGMDEMARFFSAGPNRGVWSSSVGQPGLESEAAHHGDFDDDPKTLDSVAHILAERF